MNLFKNNGRLRILSGSEISLIYDRPHFTDMERMHFFACSNDILLQLKLYNVKRPQEVTSSLYFILQHGYFKAKHLFFSFQYSDIKEDVRFIMKAYMPENKTPLLLPSRILQSRIKKKILSLQGFIDDTQKADQLILNIAEKTIRRTHKLAVIFREIVICIEKHRMILPAYSRLQKIIGIVLKNEQERLIKITKGCLTKSLEDAIVTL